MKFDELIVKAAIAAALSLLALSISVLALSVWLH
jgi:hypothetical protein